MIAKLSLRWKKKTYRNLQDVLPDPENPTTDIMESNTVKAQNLMEHNEMEKSLKNLFENGERGERENTLEEEDSLKALESSMAKITTIIEEDSEGKKEELLC